jgi:hypothetical protein
MRLAQDIFNNVQIKILRTKKIYFIDIIVDNNVILVVV